MRFLTLLGAALAAMAVFGAAHAVPVGPEPGARLPHTLSAPDHTGKTRSFAELTGEKGLVLVFARSADWCPVCQVHLMAINDDLAGFTKRGYRVAAITVDKPEKIAPFVKRRAIAFPILADPNKVVVDAFALRDPAFPKGHRIHGVPLPLVFLVSPDGVIQKKLGTLSFRDRPSPDDLFAEIDALQKR